MSKQINCPHCGKLIQVPAYEGDGVYEPPHQCEQDTRTQEGRRGFEYVLR